VTVKNKMKLNVIQNCKSDDYRLYLEGNSKFSSGVFIKGILIVCSYQD